MAGTQTQTTTEVDHQHGERAYSMGFVEGEPVHKTFEGGIKIDITTWICSECGQRVTVRTREVKMRDGD